MLCDYLNKQKDIKCHYEIFLDTGIKLSSIDSKKVTINPDIIKNNFFIKQFSESKITIEDLNLANDIIQNKINVKRLVDPILMIEAIKRHNSKKYLGCKIFYNQIHSLQNFSLIDYIKENNIKVIHLNRINKFLQELSYQKRKQTNIVTLEQNDKHINFKIVFDVGLYQDRSKLWNSLYEQYNLTFKQNNIDVLNISYEDLYKQKTKTLQTIVTFITKEANFTEIPESSLLFKKMNIYSLQDQIENFSEVYNFLKNDVHFLQALR